MAIIFSCLCAGEFATANTVKLFMGASSFHPAYVGQKQTQIVNRLFGACAEDLVFDVVT